MDAEDRTPLDEMHEALLKARQVAAFLRDRHELAHPDRVRALLAQIDGAVGTLQGLGVDLAQWTPLVKRRPRRRDGFAFDVVAALHAEIPSPRRATVVLCGLWYLRDHEKEPGRFCVPGREQALSRISVAWPDDSVSDASVAVEAWRPAAVECRLAAIAQSLEHLPRWNGLCETEIAVSESALLDWDQRGTPVPIRVFRAIDAPARAVDAVSTCSDLIA